MTDTSAPIPDLQGLQKTAREKNKTLWHSVSLDLQTITPVYGGGTSAGEPDLLLPFRPRAIKNSLRHWWWLLNRHKPEYKDNSQQLYKDMTAIWGGASDQDGESHRAKVRVRTTASSMADEFVIPYMPFRISKDKLQTTIDSPSFYALWMLKPQTVKGLFENPQENPELFRIINSIKSIKELHGNACTSQNKKFAEKLASIPGLFNDVNMPVRRILLPGMKWHLQFDMSQDLRPEQKIQIKDCLNAWLKIGGIGARTTRGLGRSRLLNPPNTQTKAFTTLNDCWDPDFFTSKANTRHSLGMDIRSDAFQAWELALSIYKNFRQARQEDNEQRRMKQSYGHLANSLRKLTTQEGHPIPKNLKNSTYTPMPEMMFGAPINYQFKKGHSKPEPKDGKINFSSKEETLDRYLSPLLVSTVHIGNGKFAPISLYFQDHFTDIKNKSIAVESGKDTRILSPNRWWPDITTIDGQNNALSLLAEEYRNDPRPNSDPLYDELMDAAFRDDPHSKGDPLAVYINFFQEHCLSK